MVFSARHKNNYLIAELIILLLTFTPLFCAFRFAQLLRPYIVSGKLQYAKFPEQAAGYPVGITAPQLRLRKVCVNYGRTVMIDSHVQNIIKAGQGKLIYHLCPEVVDN
jgi:hypothetical protein